MQRMYPALYWSLTMKPSISPVLWISSCSIELQMLVPKTQDSVWLPVDPASKQYPQSQTLGHNLWTQPSGPAQPGKHPETPAPDFLLIQNLVNPCTRPAFVTLDSCLAPTDPAYRLTKMPDWPKLLGLFQCWSFSDTSWPLWAQILGPTLHLPGHKPIFVDSDPEPTLYWISLPPPLADQPL